MLDKRETDRLDAIEHMTMVTGRAFAVMGDVMVGVISEAQAGSVSEKSIIRLSECLNDISAAALHVAAKRPREGGGN